MITLWNHQPVVKISSRGYAATPGLIAPWLVPGIVQSHRQGALAQRLRTLPAWIWAQHPKISHVMSLLATKKPKTGGNHRIKWAFLPLIPEMQIWSFWLNHPFPLYNVKHSHKKGFFQDLHIFGTTQLGCSIWMGDGRNKCIQPHSIPMIIP